MTQGEPDSDIYAMDVARFGSYASRNYTVAKGANSTHGDFRLLIRMNFGGGAPRENPATYPTLKAANGVFGVSFGTEVPLYFATDGELSEETPSLRRSNAFASVAEECRVARNGVGSWTSRPLASISLAARGLNKRWSASCRRIPASGKYA